MNSSLAAISNPVSIILGYLVVLYTVIIIPIKMYLYLDNPLRNNKNLGFTKFFYEQIRFFRMGYVLICFSMLCYFIWAVFQDSKVHDLDTISLNVEMKRNIQDHVNSYYQNSTDSIRSEILYAAYGGGLKAHYWNLLLLNHLEINDHINDIIAFSGVSGGGMGIGTFAATKFGKYSDQQRIDFMNTLKQSNPLSIELACLFGKDYFKEYIFPFIDLGKGRAKRSVNFYATMLDEMKLADQISFYEVYDSLNRRGHYFPNILINSTSLTNTYGVASGIHLKDKLPGTLDILEIKYKGERRTLSFLDALTTCNRFPFISPPANIEGKGQFLDGGYFENSGILSLYNYYNEFEFQARKMQVSRNSSKPILLSIRNDKLNYLNSLLKKNGLTYSHLLNQNTRKTRKSKGLKAVFKGAINLERVPYVTKETIQEIDSSRFKIINIDLPYYLCEKEVKKLLKVYEIEDSVWDKIHLMIEESNEKIKILLDKKQGYEPDDWGVVNPPTSRLLSKPAQLYMEAMMEHTMVTDQLKCLHDLCKK